MFGAKLGIRSLHKTGKLLRGMDMNRGGGYTHGKATGPTVGPVGPTLSDIGATKNESSRTIRLSEISRGPSATCGREGKPLPPRAG